jgi:hypothetical protein
MAEDRSKAKPNAADSGTSTQQGAGSQGTPSNQLTDKEALKAADFKATQEAADKLTPTNVADVNPGNNLNPVVEKGADKEFNTWVRAAHTAGNPEQFSPMQAAQNVRDAQAGTTGAGTNRIDDPNDEDTRWVAENVKGEPVQE